MKKTLLLLAISSFLLACSSSSNVTEKNVKEAEKTNNQIPDRDSRGYYLK